jgi:uncharacterized protein YacL
MNKSENKDWLTWLVYFILFELLVFFGLQWLLSNLGYNDQLQPENTIVPNWTKAVAFIILYILCLLFAVMIISNYMPAKHRKQLMRWVYMAMIGMVAMLFFLF